MKTLKYRLLPLLILSATLLISACTDNTSSVNMEMDEQEAPVSEGAVVTFENNGATAYVISSIEGDGVTADTGVPNPEVTMETGRRYTIDNAAGASSHPFEMRNAGNEVLLGQRGDGGSFSDDPDVNALFEGNSITFTLTAELAALLENYVCSFHPGMNGTIVIAGE
jgi:plastocyanin